MAICSTDYREIAAQLSLTNPSGDLSGDLRMDHLMNLCGAKLHILPHGYRFALDTHSCIG
ncbi:MAG: hypothetical protein SNJ57_08395 [Cyanobacteriota bacterium]